MYLVLSKRRARHRPAGRCCLPDCRSRRGRGTILRAPLTQPGRSPMSSLSRREFFGRSAAAVGALAAGGMLARAAEPARKLTSAADQVVLGNTGIKTSLVGLGTGSGGVKHSSNQVKLGEEGFRRLVRHAYDRG